MKKNLFLDDTREPKHIYWEHPQDWHLVRSYSEFKEYLYKIADTGKAENMPKIVSFDYMLESEYDGADCAHFLVDFCIKYGLDLPRCHVHSGWPNALGIISKELERYTKITEKTIFTEKIYAP